MIIEVKKLEETFIKDLISDRDEEFTLNYGTELTRDMMINNLKNRDRIVAIKRR